MPRLVPPPASVPPAITHDELVAAARKWLMGSSPRRCPVVLTEMASAAWECPDALGWYGWQETFLVECKVSRSDFRSDASKPHRRVPASGMGNWRYYLVPEGLVRPDEVPVPWGLLSYRRRGRGKSGGGVSIVRRSGRFEKSVSAETACLLSAIRRLGPALAEAVGAEALGISARFYALETLNRATVSIGDPA